MKAGARAAKPRGVVRLADVARAAEVGTSIVSRVLNGDPTVSIRPATRVRIETAARELNYRPNASAHELKLQRTTPRPAWGPATTPPEPGAPQRSRTPPGRRTPTPAAGGRRGFAPGCGPRS